MKITKKKLMWMPGIGWWLIALLDWTRKWMPLLLLMSGNCCEPSQPMTNAPIA
jgi:uncharacterized protein (DUF779 family)